MKQLIVDGVNLLTEYGVIIAGQETYKGAEADVETQPVPGRNGELIYSNRRFKNLKINYPSAIRSRYAQRIEELRSFLFSNLGYRRIETSYYPDTFRMGRIIGNIDPSKIVWKQDAGMFDITFDCKPQRYFKYGEETIFDARNSQIDNKTRFDAMPLLKVYGRGTFNLNGIDITVLANNYPYMYIDCERMDAYNGTANLNGFIEVAGDEFPVLHPGSNLLSTSDANVGRIELTPRYWTL